MVAKLLKGSEVADFLRCSKGLAYRLMAQGEIPTVRFSRKAVRVRQEDLEKFIAENLTPKNNESSKSD